MKKILLVTACCAALLAVGLAQTSDLIIKLQGGERARIAVPDFRGADAAQPLTGTFNETLWNDLSGSGVLTMVAKSLYPLAVPQRPEDFKPLPTATPPPAGEPSGHATGTWLTDWSAPPVSANYLAFGYLAVQGERLVLFGWLYNVNQADLTNAHMLGKLYFGTIDEAGARKVAHEFAADILERFGGKSLAGTRIYFVSDRSGSKEIWSMAHDGSDQKMITRYNSLSLGPEISADGKLVAFTSYSRGNPGIFIHSLETGRRLPFYNQVASMNAHPSFTPDGTRVLFSSTATGRAQIYIANLDGSGIERLTASQSLDVEPKVNPKTGSDVVFVSGRSGTPQIYRMNMLGADVERLTSGEGQAANPAWHPDGQFIAYAWTRGYSPGNFNIFVMDVVTRQYVQLTDDMRRNEHPTWAPDGRHLVFSSNRTGSSQIWTMRADGTQLRQLTISGRNTAPVWGSR